MMASAICHRPTRDDLASLKLKRFHKIVPLRNASNKDYAGDIDGWVTILCTW